MSCTWVLYSENLCNPFAWFLEGLLHFEVPQALHKNFKQFRNTKLRYRPHKTRKIKGTGQPLGTCPVPHFSFVFYVLYLGFAFQKSLWQRVGQEKQGTGQIAKAGYRTGMCHQKWTTGQVPGKATGPSWPHMGLNRSRWELQL